MRSLIFTLALFLCAFGVYGRLSQAGFTICPTSGNELPPNTTCWKTSWKTNNWYWTAKSSGFFTNVLNGKTNVVTINLGGQYTVEAQDALCGCKRGSGAPTNVVPTNPVPPGPIYQSPYQPSFKVRRVNLRDPSTWSSP